MKNHFETQGIPANASKEQIKEAYKLLSVKFHPDKNQNKTAFYEKKFHEIQEAYEILSDESKKFHYEVSLEKEIKEKETLQKKAIQLEKLEIAQVSQAKRTRRWRLIAVSALIVLLAFVAHTFWNTPKVYTEKHEAVLAPSKKFKHYKKSFISVQDIKTQKGFISHITLKNRNKIDVSNIYVRFTDKNKQVKEDYFSVHQALKAKKVKEFKLNEKISFDAKKPLTIEVIEYTSILKQ